VHPRNLLVWGSGDAAIIDFGHARSMTDGMAIQQRGRGVVDLYMDPELARSRIQCRNAEPPTFAGEQYSIATLLYYLLTGAHARFCPGERTNAATGGRRFARPAEHGIAGFANTEHALRRALEKRPKHASPLCANFGCSASSPDLDYDVQSASAKRP
jgi:serine/threonine-protein kinase